MLNIFADSLDGHHACVICVQRFASGPCRKLPCQADNVDPLVWTTRPKWHLAHTTWLFEKFVLCRDAAWQPLHPAWHYLFNSYYQFHPPDRWQFMGIQLGKGA